MRPAIRQLHRLEGNALPHPSLAHTVRYVHSSTRRAVSAAPVPVTSSVAPSDTIAHTKTPSSPLHRLPTSTVLRSYAIMRMSSSPALLSLCMAIIRRMVNSKSYLMSIERNPVLAKIFKTTFYAQFCAGESKKEVEAKTKAAREVLGYDGIMLEYALEVLGEASNVTEEQTAREIEVWKKGMLETIDMTREGDFVGLKWSGLGRRALQLLKAQQDPTPAMWSAITAACDAAAAKNVVLLPGAEEEVTNPGLEKWTLALQKKYNTPERGRAIVYITYQCYLKSIPARLAQHLVQAQKEGYIAGVKLVRGAYLATEPAALTWDTKEETDACYDACAEAVLKQQWTSTVSPPPSSSSTSAPPPFPAVNIFLGTHNHASVQKALAIRSAQLQRSSDPLPRLGFAQLQGMADEISQELAQSPQMKRDTQAKAVKCMTWGTTVECLNFLMRRASENKEAALRTEDTRRAMGAELWRRAKGVFGMA